MVLPRRALQNESTEVVKVSPELRFTVRVGVA